VLSDNRASTGRVTCASLPVPLWWRRFVRGNRNREVVASLMARRSAQSVLKRAREQALREKRELKQAKKEARRRGDDPPSGASEGDAGGDSA
jgi:hypothetical protein